MLRSDAVCRLPRSLCLIVALAGALLATWEFYFRHWLDVASPLDSWLDRHRCLMTAACGEHFDLPNHLCLLAALVAVFFFSLALRGAGDVWSREEDAATPVERPGEAWRRGCLLAVALIALSVLVEQARRALSGVTPPTPLWLIGIAAVLAAALVWDTGRPRLVSRVAADLVVGLGVVLIALGVACALAGRMTALPLCIGGGVAFFAGSRAAVYLGSGFSPRERALVLALTLLPLVLALSRAWSWRFAFVGDEWAFFNLARSLLHRSPGFSLLDLPNPGDYHTVKATPLRSEVAASFGELGLQMTRNASTAPSPFW